MIVALLLAVLGGPPVELTPLEGETIRGELLSATPVAIVLQRNGKPIESPVARTLRLDFRSPKAVSPQNRIRTVDGSRFECEGFESDGRDAHISLPGVERQSVPVERIAAVLLTNEPNEVADWFGRAAKPIKSDVLILARNGKRLALEGTLGAFGPEKLAFTFDNDELPVYRQRVRAMYFAQRPAAADPKAAATDVRGNVWAVEQWKWDDGLMVQTPAGLSVRIPAARLASLDFSPERLTYLSDMEPSAVQHTPSFDVAWNFRRDQNFQGGPLVLRQQRVTKGLAVHSRTLLEYDLAAKYRRFSADVGIEDSAGPYGDAEVRIDVDGETAWRARVRAGETPRHVSLPLGKAQRLVLFVDYGKGLDVGDHVVFGDARLVK